MGPRHFWPLAQIPGAAQIRLSHNHLGPQINGLLLGGCLWRTSSKKVIRSFVRSFIKDRQTDRHHVCWSLVCPSVCRGPENCPLELEGPKTIQDLEFLRPFPRSNCRRRCCNLQAPSAFFLCLQPLSKHHTLLLKCRNTPRTSSST